MSKAKEIESPDLRVYWNQLLSKYVIDQILHLVEQVSMIESFFQTP